MLCVCVCVCVCVCLCACVGGGKGRVVVTHIGEVSFRSKRAFSIGNVWI